MQRKPNIHHAGNRKKPIERPTNLLLPTPHSTSTSTSTTSPSRSWQLPISCRACAGRIVFPLPPPLTHVLLHKFICSRAGRVDHPLSSTRVPFASNSGPPRSKRCPRRFWLGTNMDRCHRSSEKMGKRVREREERVWATFFLLLSWMVSGQPVWYCSGT